MYATIHKQRQIDTRFCCSPAKWDPIAASNSSQEWKLLPLISLLPAILFSPASHAEFAMNFSGTTTTFVTHGNSFVGGQSPFTPMGSNEATGESVIDPSNGLRYWHYILGDPASGFAQEVYIRATGSSCGQFTICSASGGTTNFGGNVLAAGNSGNGNPNAITVRQVMGGTWTAATNTWTCDTAYCSEFIKAAYANKPKITQGISDPDFTAMFILDMSGVAISDNSTPLTITDESTGATGASLTNVQSLTDSLTGNVISFDMANDSQLTNVNGGRYIYNNGPGVLGARGTYVYVDGGYNPATVDYSPFLDDSVSNPWAYPASKP